MHLSVNTVTVTFSSLCSHIQAIILEWGRTKLIVFLVLKVLGSFTSSCISLGTIAHNSFKYRCEWPRWILSNFSAKLLNLFSNVRNDSVKITIFRDTWQEVGRGVSFSEHKTKWLHFDQFNHIFGLRIHFSYGYAASHGGLIWWKVVERVNSLDQLFCFALSCFCFVCFCFLSISDQYFSLCVCNVTRWDRDR